MKKNEYSYTFDDNILKVFCGLHLVEVKYEVADDEVIDLVEQIIEKDLHLHNSVV